MDDATESQANEHEKWQPALYRNEVALLKVLNLSAYGSSISRPRVLPEGAGRPDYAGMDSYSRLVGKPPPAGRVQDEDRRTFIRDYLAEVHRTIQAGVPLRGYFAWSLLDNFEWSLGFSKRFGIVRVDYDTLERIVKRSGDWYAKVARTNAVETG